MPKSDVVEISEDLPNCGLTDNEVREFIDQAENGDLSTRKWLGGILLGLEPVLYEELNVLLAEMRKLFGHTFKFVNDEKSPDALLKLLQEETEKRIDSYISTPSYLEINWKEGCEPETE